MAWNSSIPSSAGSIIKQSDMGQWLSDINSHANTIKNNHCSAVYSVHKTAHFTSNSSSSNSNCGNNSVADHNNNGSVNFGGTASSIKCGGEINYYFFLKLRK